LGEPLFFTEATEPSNIIWENRHVSYRKQFWRKIGAGCGISLVLLIALVFFSTLKIVSVQKSLKYPESTDCTDIEMLFYYEGTTTINMVEFEEYARIDYNSTLDA